MTANNPSDRNMLVGILALQMNFINREQLLTAMNAWVTRKFTPLEDILQEHKSVTSDTVLLLQALMAKHLELHGNNAQQSLQAISSIGALREELRTLADPDIDATLTVVMGKPSTTIVNQSIRHRTDKQDVSTRFRVIRPHAKGGLGEVFLARDTELNREVALKEIQERFAKNEDSRSRFVLEAEVTGGLEHPGIVPVYGLGHYADGRPFYAMRFIKGDSLKDAVDRFHTKYRDAKDFTTGEVGVEFRQLLGRFIDVCQAIEYAHSRGVLHRDLKPGNIMLGKFGETLVVDWGLAKVVGRAEQHQSSGETTLSPDSIRNSAATQMGSAIGTPAFMSPEQAAGDHDALGPPADVYSLGATLFCLLTGEAPFNNNGTQNVVELLEKVKTGEFKHPRELRPNVPASLEAVCLKAMAIQPASRFATPFQLAVEIEHWLADEPVSCWREPINIRTQRWVRRHKSWAVSGVLACTLIAIVSSVAAVLINSQRNIIAAKERAASELSDRNARLAESEKAAREEGVKQLEIARRNEEEATKSKTEALLQRQLAEMSSIEATIQRELAEKRSAEAVLLQQKAETSAMSERRAREDALKANDLTKNALDRAKQANELMKRFLYSAHMNLANTGWENTRVRATTDLLARYAPGTGLEQLRGFEWHYLNRLCHSEERRFVGHKYFLNSVAISPDGKNVVSASSDAKIKVWDFATGTELLNMKGHSATPCVAYSIDGKYIASAGDRSAKIWNSSTGQIIRTFDTQSVQPLCIAFSPDSQQIVLGGFGGIVKMLNIESGDIAFEIKSSTTNDLSFSPDGKQLAFVNSGEIDVRGSKDGQEYLKLSGHKNQIQSLAYSPSGESLVSASWDNTIKVWDLPTRKVRISINLGKDVAFKVRFSNSGKQIVASTKEGLVRTFDSLTGDSLKIFKGHAGEVKCAVFCPDDIHVVSCGWDSTVRIWDTTKQSDNPLVMADHPERISSFDYGRDGTKIASCNWDKSIKIWNAVNEKQIRTIDVEMSSHAVVAICLGLDGNSLVVGDFHGGISIIDIESSKTRLSWKGPTSSLSGLAMSSDGSRIASAHNGTVVLWDASKGTELHRFKCPSGLASNTLRLSFSPHGEQLAIPNTTSVSICNTSTGTEIRSLALDDCTSVGYRADGKRLVSAGFYGAKVWDVDSGRELFSMNGHSGRITKATYSPDGKRIATSSEDRTVKLWDAETGQEIITLQGADGNVTFDASGEHLAATTPDNNVIIWDARPLELPK